MEKRVAIVFAVGAQKGLGAALCRLFSAKGHHVVAVGRTLSRLKEVTASIEAAGGTAEPVVCDVTVERDVKHAFEVASRSGHLDLVAFNAGNNKRVPFDELTSSQVEDFWRVCCFAGFLVAQEAVRLMLPNGHGTLLFTGASASMRGKAGFAHFSAAKAGLRMLSQSLAREFGPQGIHVAHVVIDGGIDGDRLRNAAPSLIQARGEDGLLSPDAIAQTYWHLYQQDRSAWAQEIDLRPFKETF